MEAFFVIGFISIFAAIAYAMGREQDGGRPLDPEPPDRSTAEHVIGLLRAASGGGAARVESYVDERPGRDFVDRGLRLIVGGLARGLTIERVDSDLRSGPGPDELAVGDDAFDTLFIVGGSRADALAVLDPELRSAMLRLVRGNVRVGHVTLAGGELAVDVPRAGFAGEHPGLPSTAQAVGELARRFFQPTDVVGRLTDRVRDPLPRVRLASLSALVDEHEKDSRTREAVRNGLRDANDRVRLYAALASGADGRNTLIDLALDATAEDRCSARAIEAAGADLPLDRMEPLVRTAARGLGEPNARPATARAFVDALAGHPSDAARSLLSRLARTAHDSLGAAVIDAMVTRVGPEAETALLPLLESDQGGRGRTMEHAARRLGAIGTVAAVLPLQEAAERFDGSITSEAQRSIREIQARLALTPGRLALTEEDASGRVSVASDKDGRLSLHEGKHRDPD